jgi:CheY-like chemotaxis protein
MKQPVLLSIDDDKDFQEVLSAALNSRGFTVQTANAPEKGISMAKELKPDLILMDVQMPGKDGIATASEILENPHLKHLKIIFLTNLGDAGPMAAEINRKFAEQIGAVGYFKKGGDFNKLASEIKRLLQ